MLQGLTLTWLGHSAFHFTSPKGVSGLLDPWVMGNPACPASHKTFPKIDLMLISHALKALVRDVDCEILDPKPGETLR